MINVPVSPLIDFQKVNKEEIAELQQLGKITFYDAYLMEGTLQEMQSYLDTAFATEKLLTEMSKGTFYFIRHEEKVIGYYKVVLQSAPADINSLPAMELERLYLLKTFQGMGIGQSVFEHIVASAKLLHLSYLWLCVWDQNSRAVKFYKRNNMVPFGTKKFVFGSEVTEDMVLKLGL